MPEIIKYHISYETILPWFYLQMKNISRWITASSGMIEENIIIKQLWLFIGSLKMFTTKWLSTIGNGMESQVRKKGFLRLIPSNITEM